MTTTLFVVYPDTDASAAIMLQEKILQKFNYREVALWNLSHYQDNAAHLMNDHPLIFLGGPEGNPVTKKFFDARVVDIVTQSNSFFLGKTTNKYFLCGRLGAESTMSATEHFLEYYCEKYIKQIQEYNN